MRKESTMSTTELKNNLSLILAELDRFTVTGVSAARKIVGISNLITQCIEAEIVIDNPAAVRHKEG